MGDTQQAWVTLKSHSAKLHIILLCFANNYYNINNDDNDNMVNSVVWPQLDSKLLKTTILDRTFLHIE